jgi:IPT/TIG domain-containing protein
MKTESSPRDFLTGTCTLATALLLTVGVFAGGLQSGCCGDAARGAERAEGERNAEVPAAIGIYFLSPSSGTAGTVVDIRGYGFSTTASDNQVAFNGHPAIVLSASTDSIRTIVPAIVTSGPVTITNSNGTAVSAQSFILRALSSRQDQSGTRTFGCRCALLVAGAYAAS